MNSSTLVHQQWDEAMCRIVHRIEQSAVDALRSLGLPADTAGVQVAFNRMRDEAPLYVASIVLHGSLQQDMYDEHPGLAYFTTDTFRKRIAPRHCGMRRAQAQALALLRQAEEECGDEDDDGRFIPRSVSLVDRFGRTLQQYVLSDFGPGEASGWLESVPDASEWPVLLAEAERLSESAASESRWDNFDSARSLRNQATQLRTLVSIAELQHRVIP